MRVVLLILLLFAPAAAQFPGTLTATQIGAGATGSINAGTGAVNGSGRDISSRSDGLLFVWDKAEYTTGDQDVIAQITGIGNSHAYAKAGVMVRQTLRDDSKFAAMVLTPSGAQFLYRQTAGSTGLVGSSVVLGGESLAIRAPYYVRVRRNAQNFSGWISTDGVAWTQVGSTVRINMVYDPTVSKGHCYIGLAVSSHDTSVTSNSTCANYSETFGAASDWFYVSPTATNGTGTWADPWALRQVWSGANVTAVTDGSTVWLLGREGDYVGRWNDDNDCATGAGRCTFRSYPDERARIVGLLETTLSSNITVTTNTTFTLTNGLLVSNGADAIRVGAEIIKGSVSGSTYTTATRGFSGTTPCTCAACPTTHCVGGLVTAESPVFLYDGSFIDYRDFEVTVDDSRSRASNVDTFDPGERPTITNHLGANNRTFGLFVHDGGTSFTDQTGGDSSENYALLAYSNGMNQLNGSAGHNLYLQTDTAKTVKESFFFASFANSINVSSSNAAVVFDGNAWWAPEGASSLRINADLTVTNCFVWRDNTQFGPDLGSDSPGVIIFTDNYVTGGGKIQSFTGGGTIKRNVFTSPITNTGASLTIRHDGAGSAAYDVDDNKYYRGRAGLKQVLQIQSVPHAYNASQSSSPFWQSLSGSVGTYEDNGCVYSNEANDQTATAACFFHENSSTAVGVEPTQDKVFLRTNAFDSNRAHVIAFNWDGNGSVTVDPTGFLTAGDIYEIRYAGDPFGDPQIVATLYASGNITLPMTDRPLAQRKGYWSQLPSGLPVFGAFIIWKR